MSNLPPGCRDSDAAELKFTWIERDKGKPRHRWECEAPVLGLVICRQKVTHTGGSWDVTSKVEGWRFARRNTRDDAIDLGEMNMRRMIAERRKCE